MGGGKDGSPLFSGSPSRARLALVHLQSKSVGSTTQQGTTADSPYAATHTCV